VSDSSHARSDESLSRALRDADLLDSPPEPDFDRITTLASRLFDAPISLVTVITDTRQFFKSACGLSLRETPIGQSLCVNVVRDARPLCIRDGPDDARFRDHFAFTDLRLRSYLGVPVRTRDDLVVASLCVADTRAREWTDADESQLSELAELVTTEIELRRQLRGRSEALDEMRAEHDLLEEMMRTSIGAIVIVDPAGRILFTNDRAESILGVAPRELKGRVYNEASWRHITVDGLPLPDEVHPFRIVMATGRPVFDVRHAIEWTDGRRRVLSINGAPIKNPAGHIVRLVFLATDITDHLAAEAALRASEEKFSKAFHASPDAICVLRRSDWTIIEANEGFGRIFGLPPAAALQRTPDELGLWPDPAVPRELAATLAHTPRLRDRPVELLRADGTRLQCLLSAEFITVGRAEHVVVVLRDVTADHAARVAREELESQLHQARKMEAVGTLAGGIAHDFNNILTGILGHAELARATIADRPETAASLSAIIKGSLRARDLVRQILTFSRRKQQKREPIALAPVVREALTLLRPSLPAGIRVELSLPAVGPLILGEAGQLHQVVLNIGANAAHAMGREGVLALELRETVVEGGFAVRHPRLPRGRCAVLSIRDTGHGMDEPTLERLFTPFFTTKPLGQGTGLGLAVVHGIVLGHDGGILVESTPRVGSVFHLYFPALETAEPASPSVDSRPPMVTPGAGQRVLFIDDEPFVADAAGSALRLHGFHPAVYTDPIAALASFTAAPDAFDLVITDYIMPGLTGYEVMRRILACRPGLPIVLATGHAAGLDPGALHRLGACAVLEKPYSLEALAAVVREHALAPPGPRQA
jgi:PAS domain S-box-containing protein